MINFSFNKDLNVSYVCLLYPPNTVLDVAPTATTLMRTVLSSRDGLVDKVNSPIFSEFISQVNVVDLIPIFVDVDLVIELRFFLRDVSDQKDTAETVFPESKVIFAL
jgi:hypothetical protein